MVAVLASYADSLTNFRGALVRRIVAQGHRVYCIAPPAADAEDEIRALGATFIPIDLQRTGMNPVADVRTSRALETLFRRQGIDTLLAYTIKPIVLGLPAASRAGVGTRVALVTGMGYAFGTETLRQRAVRVVAKALYRRALQRATAIRFQNHDDLAEFTRMRLADPAISAVVAGSGVDVDYYAEVPPPKGSTVRFLLIARLIAEKGIREYAAAARSIRGMRSDCEFHVLGPADSNPTSLRTDEIASWVRDGTLTVHPACRDVRPFLEQCSVYVLPSYREGTPRTVLEAMATGRPIITSDAPGCRETTTHGENGFVVPVKDHRALADAMLALADDRSLRARMGRRSREIAEEKYDVHKVNEDMMRSMELLP